MKNFDGTHQTSFYNLDQGFRMLFLILGLFAFEEVFAQSQHSIWYYVGWLYLPVSIIFVSYLNFYKERKNYCKENGINLRDFIYKNQ